MYRCSYIMQQINIVKRAERCFLKFDFMTNSEVKTEECAFLEEAERLTDLCANVEMHELDRSSLIVLHAWAVLIRNKLEEIDVIEFDDLGEFLKNQTDGAFEELKGCTGIALEEFGVMQRKLIDFFDCNSHVLSTILDPDGYPLYPVEQILHTLQGAVEADKNVELVLREGRLNFADLFLYYYVNTLIAAFSSRLHLFCGKRGRLENNFFCYVARGLGTNQDNLERRHFEIGESLMPREVDKAEMPDWNTEKIRKIPGIDEVWEKAKQIADTSIQKICREGEKNDFYELLFYCYVNDLIFDLEEGDESFDTTFAFQQAYVDFGISKKQGEKIYRKFSSIKIGN